MVRNWGMNLDFDSYWEMRSVILSDEVRASKWEMQWEKE
jgi:hypothetical protein